MNGHFHLDGIISPLCMCHCVVVGRDHGFPFIQFQATFLYTHSQVVTVLFHPDETWILSSDLWISSWALVASWLRDCWIAVFSVFKEPGLFVFKRRKLLWILLILVKTSWSMNTEGLVIESERSWSNRLKHHVPQNQIPFHFNTD